jgi:hypothetical protein
MKTFVKTFRGKMSYKKIDKYVNLVRKTLDPDDYFDIEFQHDDDWQHIKIKVWDRVLH